MGVIHELLAVEKDVRGAVAKIIAETRHTFVSKQQHFEERIISFQEFEKEGESKDLVQESHSPMADTVPSKVDYFQEHVGRLLDIILQKEASNAEAKADVVIKEDDGSEKVLVEGVVVSALIQGVAVFDKIRTEVYMNIPTLDPKKSWREDGNREGVMVADDVRKTRTELKQAPVVLYEATDKHPAQVQLIQQQIEIGTIIEQFWSGCISSAEKAKRLKRLDNLIAALKAAKARANSNEVKKVTWASRLMKYIDTGE